MLTTEHISFQHEEQVILKDITTSFEKGSHTTITGPSGSGKSTFLKLLASLLTPTKGAIMFNGQNIADLTPEKYRKQVSYCFQQPSLFGETVRDNFMFPYEVRKIAFQESDVLNLLNEVKLPESYLDKKINELSGGEKQRIALIRNVIFLPEVLLLDEVTAGLDEESKAIVNQWLLKLNQEKNVTLIRVTHDPEEIAQASIVKKIIAGSLEGAK
ncbi:ABC transporter ATP-binding protein [Enterococcus haemoperoxidus ATCC BAA-382]|uniref:ABC transporter ATP-binding protein n=1 Tax=Enterococcus haemoperoxidus ATCC BAA-382 TaxID=1158608 RepID=R2SZ69_9ENTE|nr:ATP-binding cassette domain-containing protein [Enterococcus haemoperoxidus]EOH93334.1 ABC transporter ATP-binding protein [Enterococcus haemoperoxidus ATCC BAA-382]EOT61288.1 ABC transporter ATP-binding protein [Enterococcus haemoperoxidus ATCC BAA-382]OJG54469.1 ABC transporter ATP-binding protein [Enterococcus haemoperoxidus]